MYLYNDKMPRALSSIITMNLQQKWLVSLCVVESVSFANLYFVRLSVTGWFSMRGDVCIIYSKCVVQVQLSKLL